MNMKINYWISMISCYLLLVLLIITGCTQTTTQSSPASSTDVSSISDIPAISTLDAYTLIQNNEDNHYFIILDVRTADEYKSGYIIGAINIDYYSTEFQADIGKLDKNKQYLVYCKAGVRSAAAVRIMLDLGFQKTQNLDGGITKWIQDGYLIVK